MRLPTALLERSIVNYDFTYSFFSFSPVPTNSTTHTWRNSRISIIHAEKVHSGTYSCSVDNTTSSTVNIQILMGRWKLSARTREKESFFIFTPRAPPAALGRSSIGVTKRRNWNVYDGKSESFGPWFGVKYVHKISNQFRRPALTTLRLTQRSSTHIAHDSQCTHKKLILERHRSLARGERFTTSKCIILCVRVGSIRQSRSLNKNPNVCSIS